MNALSILRHAYTTISNAHPEKDAFALVADVEALVKRMVDAASSLESRVVGKAETPAAVEPSTIQPAPVVTSPVAPSNEPDTLYPLPPLPAA